MLESLRLQILTMKWIGLEVESIAFTLVEKAALIRSLNEIMCLKPKKYIRV